MRTIVLVVPCVLVLAACGGEREESGSLGWDAGVGVIEVQGDGAYTLEVKNDGAVDLQLEGRNPDNLDSNRSPIRRGSSLRHEVSGPRVYRLTPAGPGQAKVTYVFRSEDGQTLFTRIEP